MKPGNAIVLKRTAWLAFVVFASWPAAAQEDRGPAAEQKLPLTNAVGGARGAFSLRVENDVFAGTDEDYSNGIAVSWQQRGRGLLGGFWNLFGDGDREYFQGYEAGQIIITPQDKTLAVPDPKDRPYAGLLYLAFSTAIRRGNQFHGLKLVTGVVGPYSRAEQTQIWYHHRIGSPIPQGWAHQLHNEPILNFVYEHRRKYQVFAPAGGFGADIIPGATVMLGNVLVQGQAGAQLRLGWNLPDDFGTSLVRGFSTMPFPQYPVHAPKMGVFVFGSLGGAAVARNLTLDGNTFQDSPRVDKRPFYASGELGASFWTRRFQASFSYVMWGKEFYGQQLDSKFGAISVTFFF